MFDINMLDPEARLFFDSMDPLLQETIMQSGVEFSTREELENYAMERGRIDAL